MQRSAGHPDEPVTLIGHSHGGNVIIIAANILKKEYNLTVDYVITINTPVREYQLNDYIPHYQIYHKNDPVQGGGSSPEFHIGSNYIGEKPKGEYKLLGMASNDIKRSFNKAFNLELPFTLKFHNSHNSPELWAGWLKEKIAITNSWRKINTSK
jgi:hypothetical protein